jgi:hypothetical protein
MIRNSRPRKARNAPRKVTQMTECTRRNANCTDERQCEGSPRYPSATALKQAAVASVVARKVMTTPSSVADTPIQTSSVVYSVVGEGDGSVKTDSS